MWAVLRLWMTGVGIMDRLCSLSKPLLCRGLRVDHVLISAVVVCGCAGCVVVLWGVVVESYACQTVVVVVCRTAGKLVEVEVSAGCRTRDSLAWWGVEEFEK